YVHLLETARATYPIIRPPYGGEAWRLLTAAYQAALEGQQAPRVALEQAQAQMLGFIAETPPH
ncbi:MAG TPA: hypothetical protein VF234_02090, partial [Limnochordia bacterium]